MRVNTQNGFAEVSIDDNCAIDRFDEIVRILQTNFDVAFTDKCNDLESIYWDFTFKGAELTLHYNIYMGVLVYPKNLTRSTDLDNQTVLALAQKLMAERNKSQKNGADI